MACVARSPLVRSCESSFFESVTSNTERQVHLQNRKEMEIAYNVDNWGVIENGATIQVGVLLNANLST
jgi:hypothetical protein